MAPFGLSSSPSAYIKGTPFQRLYYRWMAIRFSWRKRYFCGMDLDGNTYWEFRDQLHPSKPRRIVDFKGGHSLSAYADHKIDPQWHQWLRATRLDAPSIPELEADIIRRKKMVEKARLADLRWQNKESMLDMPKSPLSAIAGEQQQQQQQLPIDGREGNAATQPNKQQQEQWVAQRQKHDIFEGPGGRRPEGPSEGYQPEGWTPSAKRK